MVGTGRTRGRRAIYLGGFLFGFLLACGGKQESSHTLTEGTLETLSSEPSSTGAPLGEGAPPGFLRPCQTMVSGGGLVELHCDDYRIVEFRKDESAATSVVLDSVLKLLEARFGPIEDRRRDARIDRLQIEVSDFNSKSGTTLGLAAAVTNKQGRYWGFACYRKEGEGEVTDFCGAAIATAARTGGLAFAGAKPMEVFGGGKITVPKDCQLDNARITCPSGQLSWSVAEGRDASTLRDETLAKLTSMAKQEKVSLAREDKVCKLLGAGASCLYLKLERKSKSESLHFVLVTGGEQDRLVVCSFPAFAGTGLPQPCNLAIEWNE